MNLFKFLSFTCVVSIFSCGQRSSKISESINNQSLDTLTHAFDNKKIDTISAFETYLISYGLTNLSEIDKSIQVDLKYASKDNFVGIPLYGDIQHAYLQQEVGLMLKEAQQYLKEYDSTLSIIVYDATRPHSVQQVMWDSCKMPFEDKTKFLSNPKNSSVHNYGAAVDVSIFDMKKNKALDMGTPFDDNSKKSYPSLEKYYLKKGELTEEHIKNRELLRTVMIRAKFRMLPSEWWHFNAFSRVEAKKKYQLVK